MIEQAMITLQEMAWMPFEKFWKKVEISFKIL